MSTEVDQQLINSLLNKKKLGWRQLILVTLAFVVPGLATAFVAAHDKGWFTSAPDKAASQPCVSDLHVASGAVVTIHCPGSTIALRTESAAISNLLEPKSEKPNSLRPPISDEKLLSPQTDVASVAKTVPPQTPQQQKIVRHEDLDPFVGRSVLILRGGNVDAYVTIEKYRELCIIHDYPQCHMPLRAGRWIPIRVK
jgi:hypothetical protein